jgi:hypothetical protein
MFRDIIGCTLHTVGHIIKDALLHTIIVKATAAECSSSTIALTILPAQKNQLRVLVLSCGGWQLYVICETGN